MFTPEKGLERLRPSPRLMDSSATISAGKGACTGHLGAVQGAADVRGTSDPERVILNACATCGSPTAAYRPSRFNRYCGGCRTAALKARPQTANRRLPLGTVRPTLGGVRVKTEDGWKYVPPQAIDAKRGPVFDESGR